MSTVKKNPGKMTVREHLVEAVSQLEACSKSSLELIASFENLIKRFKHCLVQTKSVSTEEQAEDAVRWERDAIRRARRGR
jgi:hypothetical protein